MSKRLVAAFIYPNHDPEEWRGALAPHFPGLDLREWPHGIGDPAEIEVALVWTPPEGTLAALPNLKAVVNLGAGVEKLLADPTLPDVPVIRMVDETLTRGMGEYVLHWVLHLHRDFHRYEEFRRQRQWRKLAPVDTGRRRVGILGQGVLGADAARKVAALGFPVAGWSRTGKSIDGVEPFAGAAGLRAFLERTDILVCLLPLTGETRGILDARAFARLPAGAYLVNAARGGHVVAADLIAALDSGHLAGAVLDVFEPEPLPADDPYWRHPKVIVTPHVASLTVPDTWAPRLAANIRQVLGGEAPVDGIDRARGY